MAELASVNGEQADVKKAVEHWIHRVRLRKTDMEDPTMPDCLLLHGVDARILACISHEPIS
jgi:hypothetical protein